MTSFNPNRPTTILSKIETKDWESHWDVHRSNITQIILDYFIYEGLHTQATIFAAENDLEYKPDPFMLERATLRNLFISGNIDQAIHKLNVMWSNFIDENSFFYYFLMEHKVFEMINATKNKINVKINQKSNEDTADENAVEEITKYIRQKLGDIVLNNKELVPFLEDLVEHLIFKKFDINEKRVEIANYVNKCLMDSKEIKCVLKGYVEEVVNAEKSLGKNHLFPTFEQYFKQGK